jgi:phosphatidylglycerophosphate synthase
MANQKKYSLKEIIEKKKRPVEPSYITHILKKIAIYLVYLFQNLPITANQVTIFTFVLVFLAILFLLILNSKIVFILLLIASYIFDSVDGLWSRVKNQTSTFGDFFDRYIDFIKDYLIDLCFIIYYLDNLSEIISDSKLLLTIISLYFIFKGLFYLIRDFKNQIQPRVFTSCTGMKLFHYGGAEKFTLVYPLVIFSYTLFLIYITGYFFLYFFNILVYLKKIYLILNNQKNSNI